MFQIVTYTILSCLDGVKNNLYCFKSHSIFCNCASMMLTAAITHMCNSIQHKHACIFSTRTKYKLPFWLQISASLLTFRYFLESLVASLNYISCRQDSSVVDNSVVMETKSWHWQTFFWNFPWDLTPNKTQQSVSRFFFLPWTSVGRIFVNFV